MTADEIRALARMLDRIDYYRLLRVKADVSSREIRAAHRVMRKLFHPDRFRMQSPELVQAVDQIARRLNEANAALSNDACRATYDEGLAEGTLRFSAAAAEAAKAQSDAYRGMTPNGRRFHGLATDELKTGNLAKAMAHLTMARTFEPGNKHFKKQLEDLQARIPKPDKKASYAIR